MQPHNFVPFNRFLNWIWNSHDESGRLLPMGPFNQAFVFARSWNAPLGHAQLRQNDPFI